MLFNSPVFVLGFLPLTLSGFFLAGRLYGPRAALAWLLAADLAFYGWWNPRYLPLLVGSVGVNYVVGQRILRLSQERLVQDPLVQDRLAQAGRHDAARIWLIGGIVFNLGLLAEGLERGATPPLPSPAS